MSRLWRGRVQRVGWALIGVAVLVVGVWIVVRALGAHDDSEFTQWVGWANILALLTGALGTALVVFDKVARRDDTVSNMAADQLVERDLTVRIEGEWAREAVLRQVSRPAPVLVRWSSTGRPAASRDAVLGIGHGVDWRPMSLDGDVTEIVEAFRALPYRQLVVLGEPGAGKTVLAMLLTLGLIHRPEPGQPVPVLFPINAWDPASESVDKFLARRLAEDYGDILRSAGDVIAVAERLVQLKRVLPVLDGLDELPADRHAEAIEALNQFGLRHRPLVVTCRGREYERAVISHKILLARAAVVEIEPVEIETAIAYLSYPEPARPRWAPVFTHLRQHPDGHLAGALSSPLMAAVARTAYEKEPSNPSELLTLPSREAVINRLMDAFVAAVYTNPSLSQAPTRLGVRAYTPERARRWLECLAYHLYQAATRDLHWWQMRPDLLASRPLPARLLTLSTAVVAAATAAALVGGLVGGAWLAARAATATAIVVAASATGVFRPLWRNGYLQHSPQKYESRRLDQVPLRLGFGFGCAALTGLLTLEMTSTVAGGLFSAMLIALLPTWSPPAGGLRAAPNLSLRLNRRFTAAAALQYGGTGGMVFAVVCRLTQSLTASAMVGITAAVVYGSAAALCAGGWTWTRFRLTHARLVCSHRLPLRLSAFLDDAHRRGVLRQAGPVYQFRHALLQDHLARSLHRHRLSMGAGIGDRSAGEALAEMLAAEGRIDEAVAVLRPWADTGWRAAVNRSLELLTAQGRIDEAIAVLRPWAAIGDGQSNWLLVELLKAHGRIDEAIAILQAWADTGDEQAPRRLVELLKAHGRIDELRARADAGDPWSASGLAELLAARGHVDELRARADAGDWRAASGLAELLAARGHFDEAITVLRPWADDGNRDATDRLVELLTVQGRVDEAIAVLWERADAGVWYLARQLADLLAAHDRIDELRARAHVGDSWSASRLADLLTAQGSPDEAIGVLRPWADVGDRLATRRLAELLAAQGRIDEAVALLRPLADAGDWNTVNRLEELLTAHGRIDEAIAIWRARVDAGHVEDARRLAELLAAHGRIDELRARADAGDGPATERLAELLAARGHVEELRARADAGDESAAWRLADLLGALGRIDEAIAVLRAGADAGDMVDLWRLVDLLAAHGRIDELRARADAGDGWAASRLAELLAARGRIDEAIAVLRAQIDAAVASDRRRSSIRPESLAQQLADLLAGHGDIDEAVAVLRPWADAGDRTAARRLAQLLAKLEQRKGGRQ